MTTGSDSVFEISFMMRVVWDLHSLNNEGTVGNVTEPRTVVLADGRKTDGVSGEMLKHIHTFNVWLTEQDKTRFCPGCQRLQPQKADLPEYRAKFKGKGNIEAMSAAIANCVLCDLHGFLMQAPAIARRSVVEFGWAIGIPDHWHRDTHVHARHAVGERMQREERQQARAERRSQDEDEEVAAQMVYHRPTRSGVYALVSLFQPWRIGLNDIDYQYAVTEENSRLARYRLALEAYKNMLQRADGAMTSTRLPHLEAVEGVIAVSHRNGPAPVISPLRDDYVSQLQSLANSTGALSLHSFNSVAQACQILDKLAKATIYPFRKG